MIKINSSDFYIVEVSALPETILKVMEAKRLLESGKEKTIQAAVSAVGISRSAFYKYQNSVFPFYENSRGKTMTVGLNLDDIPGLLSDVLNMIAAFGANLLTINQTIPLNRVANVTLTIETGKMQENASELIEKLQQIGGVHSLKIIARE
jgi:chorismate mutase